jgi:excisionase family DNA binding protein
MDEASRAQRNNRGVSKGFYTISEAAKVLGVGQRRILEMVETKELEGKRDPTSGRWKISMHAVHELAAEESLGTKQPLLTENAPVTEEDTVELQVLEERQSTEEKSGTEEPLLTNQNPREERTERFSGQSEEHLWERIDELERLNKRLQVEQQTEKAAWQEERGSLLAATDRQRQYAEELREEVERLSTELETERSKGFVQRLFGG